MEAITVSAGEGEISKPTPASPAWDELCLGSADSICLVRDARLLGVWCSLTSGQKGFLRSERREAGYLLYFPLATKRNCSCGNSVSILGAMLFPRTASFFLHLSLSRAICPILSTFCFLNLFPSSCIHTKTSSASSLWLTCSMRLWRDPSKALLLIPSRRCEASCGGRAGNQPMLWSRGGWPRRCSIACDRPLLPHCLQRVMKTRTSRARSACRPASTT